ncbi:hypothetical protein SAMN05421743_101359 [Thalassobacillus cyri]|uniref:Uncharacterized protein n=1 Tax=Thalassobacillus cyri TaxID=571932 RepID=A0A1H3W8G8_9BACI|nr:hypothetical protein SAMN05421743_101359 [Thalassobacillus cyri]
MKGKLSYEAYIELFLITIILGGIGILLFLVTNNFVIFFVSLISGVLIDMLKFAAKIYSLQLSEGNSNKKGRN